MSNDELIEARASRWLAARDARAATPEEAVEFNTWLDEDIRHRVAYLRLEASWLRADRLRDVRPLDGARDPELLRPQSSRRPWIMALAAGLVVAVLGGTWLWQQQFSWQRYETRVGGFSRIVLEDGSVIDLNTNSDVRVRLRHDRREVRLVRGEGRFQVAHDRERPFTVAAADTAVRAVGTAFSVRLRGSERVDVLVSEGKVAVAAQHASAPPLTAGEAAIVADDRVSVSRVEPQVLARRMAWTAGRLEFRGETLGEAIEEFNRYNRRQIRLSASSLAELRVGGSFSATDPESFAGALASAFRLRVALDDSNEIVLIPL
ncbi:MAG TPA: FecR domain-containing protein [Steroidobacteraceae bacterium]|jgi:transmembrane sensor